MTQPTTTRRDLLRLGTSAAAYAAGAAIVTGGVALASQAKGAALSRYEVLRREYVAIYAICDAREWDDHDPVFTKHCDRLGEIEYEMVKESGHSVADAKAKLRFACDVADRGSVLDGDDATGVLRDVMRFLAPEEA